MVEEDLNKNKTIATDYVIGRVDDLKKIELDENDLKSFNHSRSIDTNNNTIICHSLGNNWFNDNLLFQNIGYNSYNNETNLWTTANYHSWYLSILYNVAGSITRDTSKLIPLSRGTYTIQILDFVDNSNHIKPISYRLFDSNGEYISSESTSETIYILNVEYDSYLDICRTNSTGSLSFSNIMISKGSFSIETMPIYEPYAGCLYGLELYDMIEPNFMTNNYYINCGIIFIFLALIILIINAPFIFIRKFKGN